LSWLDGTKGLAKNQINLRHQGRKKMKNNEDGPERVAGVETNRDVPGRFEQEESHSILTKNQTQKRGKRACLGGDSRKSPKSGTGPL